MIDGNFEATKLGEDNGDPFKTEAPIDNENIRENLSLKGTTLGSESEFEQSLKEAEVAPAVEAKKENKPTRGRQEKVAEVEEMYGMPLRDYIPGELMTGTIITIERTGIFVDIQFKCEGFVSNEELNMSPSQKEELKVGDDIRLMLVQLETKEGYTILSKKKADWEGAWDDAYEASKNEEIVEAEVVSAVKGGLVANYKNLKGFIPASLVNRNKDEHLKSFVYKKIKVTLIEVDHKRKKIIMSNKAAGAAAIEPKHLEALAKIEVGQVLKGKVTSIKNFGAFVNIDGIEGLIHISEVSWDRIDKVEDVVNVGDEIDVFILGVDMDSQKVSLGLKQLTPDPWESVAETYPIGAITTGTINRLATFGAFVKLDDGLEGLIHISELSSEHVKNVEDVISAGDKVTIKVLRVIPEEQKIGLSLKQAGEEVAAISEEIEVTEAPVVEVAVEITEEPVAPEAVEEEAEGKTEA